MEPVLNLLSHIIELLRDPTSAVFVIALVALLVAGLAVHSMAAIARQREK